MLLRYKCHTFQSHAYKACNFVVTKWYKSTFACFLTFEGSSHALRLVPFLPARTKETTSKYLHDEVTQQNHSTLLHFKKQGNTKNNRLIFLRVKKEFYVGLCIFQPHTPYSMLLARFKIWGRTQTPRGGLPSKNDGSARRKFEIRWAWLPNIFTPKRYQFKTTQQPTLWPFFFSIEYLLLFMIFVIIVITIYRL